MRHTAAMIVLALAAASASAQGPLGLLPTGEYACALPGNAAGSAWIAQPSRDFTILRASRYRTADGWGTYLVKGDTITFTRGPLQGDRMIRASSTMVREISEDGKPGRLRCQRIAPVRRD